MLAYGLPLVHSFAYFENNERPCIDVDADVAAQRARSRIADAGLGRQLLSFLPLVVVICLLLAEEACLANLEEFGYFLARE